MIFMILICAAGLGEFRIRDLNDEINKLLREKGHWEAQIKELGGPDYARTGPKMLDHEGREVPGNKGYKYFGAAKELPGIKNYHLMLIAIHSCVKTKFDYVD
jgi:pre-mRNA-splicing factor ISY1